jgi:predicted transcriptional regulator
MSARRLNIGIRNSVERSKAVGEAIRRMANNDLTPQDPELYFENLEELRRILTEKRLALLLAIIRHQPSSIRELAGLLERDYKNVSTDITLLAQLGLVKLEDSGTGRAQIPSVPYDEIQVTINLRNSHAAHAA